LRRQQHFFSHLYRALNKLPIRIFDAKVAHPAYTKNGPKVLFDEAHKNFHTAAAATNHSLI